MITVILNHEVKNYNHWQTFFHADNDAREDGGIYLRGLYTSADNPNDVTMIFEAPDSDVFHALFTDPDRQKVMERAGVISEPKVMVLEKK